MNLIQEIPFNHNFEAIIIKHGLEDDVCNFLKKYKNPVFICDENTKNIINLSNNKITFPANIKPLLEYAYQVSQIDTDVFVAVGSGTINDITKYGAFLASKPYISYATAASMNGYASGGASLIDNGKKKSLIANHAKAVFMDLEIISSAPERLRLAGIADSLAFITVKLDNLLANEVRQDKFYSNLYNFLTLYQDKIIDDLNCLCKMLIFSGIAMNVAGSSAPASQSEHMLAHYMEMMQPNAPQSLHGEQIAVTMVSVARLMEQCGNEIKVKNFNKDEVISHFGNSDFVSETIAKYSNLSGKIFNVTKPDICADVIETKLKSIGLPTHPEQIGWDSKIYNNGLNFARYMRNRFTYLDVENSS